MIEKVLLLAKVAERKKKRSRRKRRIQTEKTKTTFRKWTPVVDANGADAESRPRGREGCAYECAEEDEGADGGGGGGGGA